MSLFDPRLQKKISSALKELPIPPERRSEALTQLTALVISTNVPITETSFAGDGPLLMDNVLADHVHRAVSSVNELYPISCKDAIALVRQLTYGRWRLIYRPWKISDMLDFVRINNAVEPIGATKLLEGDDTYCVAKTKLIGGRVPLHLYVLIAEATRI